ncbi:MAG: RluA family pseudouridine synthase [Parcubacteria group bacterium]|nr:RluA family pseudouridine synthase [Parcubacteria group bacterium]
MTDALQIIYEDADLVAVNKPAGMLVHPAHSQRKDAAPVLTDMLSKQYPEIRGVGEDPVRPGIVHRLDKDTSGVLLVARTQSAFMHLKILFGTRQIKKVYLALVAGILKQQQGIIAFPISRSQHSPFKRSAGIISGRPVQTRGTSREAITAYRVRETFPKTQETQTAGAHADFSLLEAEPKTGRTHQLRVHFAAIGHPVACDKQYGGRKVRCPFGLTRQFLHASILEFLAPSGKRLRLEAGLAEDLAHVLVRLRKIR